MNVKNQGRINNKLTEIRMLPNPVRLEKLAQFGKMKFRTNNCKTAHIHIALYE